MVFCWLIIGIANGSSVRETRESDIRPRPFITTSCRLNYKLQVNVKYNRPTKTIYLEGVVFNSKTNANQILEEPRHLSAMTTDLRVDRRMTPYSKPESLLVDLSTSQQKHRRLFFLTQ